MGGGGSNDGRQGQQGRVGLHGQADVELPVLQLTTETPDLRPVPVTLRCQLHETRAVELPLVHGLAVLRRLRRVRGVRAEERDLMSALAQPRDPRLHHALGATPVGGVRDHRYFQVLPPCRAQVDSRGSALPGRARSTPGHGDVGRVSGDVTGTRLPVPFLHRESPAVSGPEDVHGLQHARAVVRVQAGQRPRGRSAPTTVCAKPPASSRSTTAKPSPAP